MQEFSSKILFVFLLMLCLLSCRVNIEQQRNSIPSKVFVKELWQSNDILDVRWAERPEMARYLINEKILINKTRSEIIEIIGEPDFVNSDKPNEIGYELEQIIGDGANLLAIESLRITFNPENRAETAKIDFQKTGRWKD